MLPLHIELSHGECWVYDNFAYPQSSGVLNEASGDDAEGFKSEEGVLNVSGGSINGVAAARRIEELTIWRLLLLSRNRDLIRSAPHKTHLKSPIPSAALRHP